MITSKSEGRYLNGKGGRRGARARAWRSRRAVSDVVATILLLGLTVTLFASIFFFVTSFPSPPSQNSNQFQATLSTQVNLSSPTPHTNQVTAVNILHLAGPPVLQYTLIYLKSSVHPNGPEFANPYTLAEGGIPSTTVWNLGQTWTLTNFTDNQLPALPDNITIYIVQGTSLLFSVVIPGTVLQPPPVFVSAYTTPASPVIGGSFVVTAQISGLLTTSTVMITLSGLPGSFSASPVAMAAGPLGLWTYTVPVGKTTASGNYYVFITATNSASKAATTAVPVDITNNPTLISSAFSVNAAGAETKCTAGYTVAANGCKGGDYIYTLAISYSTVTFGSIFFQVLQASGIPYSAAGLPTFSIVNITSHTVRAYYTQTTSGGPFVMTSTTPSTYPTPAVITAASGLPSGYYDIVIDTAVTTTTWAGNNLQFVAVGQGAYYGTTVPAALP